MKGKWNYNVGIIFAFVACLVLGCDKADRKSNEPIKVGLLHSSTGEFSPCEKPVMEATLLAIEEINAAGGVLKKCLEPVIVDGASSENVFAREVEVLIQKKGVSVVFGGSCLRCRKRIRSIIERYKHLLFYPYSYEGMEVSSNIVYCGESASQRIVPAISWVIQNLGNRIFVVSSDAGYSKRVNDSIKDQIYALYGTIVGEVYISDEDSKSLLFIGEEIRKARPDVILNTATGISSVTFLQELRRAEIYPDAIPTMIFNFSEEIFNQWDSLDIVGDYTIGSYLSDIRKPGNKKLEERFQKKYGKERIVDGIMEAAYLSVHLWAQAVEEGHTHIPQKVLGFIGNQSFMAENGLVYIDPKTQGSYKRVRIGKIEKRGQCEIVWDSEKSISPQPYLLSRPVTEDDDNVF